MTAALTSEELIRQRCSRSFLLSHGPGDWPNTKGDPL